MKQPFATPEQFAEIAARFGTPFHLYDERGIRENARRLYEAFSWNSGFREFFAVKATPNPAILRVLREEGCGLDCASLTELMLAERAGVTGKGIMFSSNVTPDEEFRLAVELGAIINLDDITHIDVLENAVGTLPDTICCRFNPGGTFQASNSVMDTPGEAKYGMTRGQLTEAFAILKAKGVKRFGIHSFLVSNALTSEYYPRLAELLFTVAAELKEETGVAIEFINLSGGIGVPYKPDEAAVDIKAVGAGVRAAYEKILVPAGLGEVAIYSELGRYMLAPYGCLVGTALREKHTYREYIGLDASAVDLMRPAMYGAYHHITVAGKENAPATEIYDITGSLCENNDKFAINRKLPKIALGDLLVLHDTGAHGYSMGYNYNGKLRSKELLLKEDGSVELIRRAETPEDYFATLNYGAD
jgi:diaminopimelate decarboxylase